jgi:hypothetical protein
VKKVNATEPIWEKISQLENCGPKLGELHRVFRDGTEIFNKIESNKVHDVPPLISNGIFTLRLLLDLAIDNFDKFSNELRWADPNEWLANLDNVETIPLFTCTSATVLAHPTAILSILQLLPSIQCHQDGDGEEKGKCHLDEWAASAQLYISLVLKVGKRKINVCPIPRRF